VVLSMMLIFPNGERSRVSLGSGLTRVGSARNNVIVLRNSSMPLLAAEIRRENGETSVTPYSGVQASLNGVAIYETVPITVGDRFNIAGVEMVVATAWSEESRTMMESPHIEWSPAAENVAYLLKAINGAGVGSVYPIPGVAIVGRSPDCDIVLPQPDISRYHARLKPTIDGVVIEDIGSTNGVVLCGIRIRKQLLSPGDTFRLGRYFFLLCAREFKRAASGHMWTS